MKQVPEGKKLDGKEQLKRLRSKIVGNQAFGFCRGKFSQPIGQLISDLIEKSGSPTEVLTQWDSFMGQARVMVNTLALLRRDGMKTAHRHLMQALDDSDHLLPGEKYPIESTKPITVLMLEPEKNLTLLRWLLESHWSSLRGYLAWKDKIPNAEEPDDLTKKLYEQFPTLETSVRAHSKKGVDGFFEGPELQEAHATISATFRAAILKKRIGLGCLAYGQWNDHIEDVQSLRFLYVFEGEQSQILAQFSRKDQKRIASWQINIPKGQPLYSFGLVPKEWQVKDNARLLRNVSRGSSHGFKAISCTNGVKFRYPIPSQGEAKPGKYWISII